MMGSSLCKMCFLLCMTCYVLVPWMIDIINANINKENYGKTELLNWIVPMKITWRSMWLLDVLDGRDWCRARRRTMFGFWWHNVSSLCLCQRDYFIARIVCVAQSKFQKDLHKNRTLSRYVRRLMGSSPHDTSYIHAKCALVPHTNACSSYGWAKIQKGSTIPHASGKKKSICSFLMEYVSE